MIDVLMATYNGEKYIKVQLDSILNQTEQDFRILIRDDGSSDKTLDIVQEYEKNYPGKVILIKDDKHCGKSASNFMELTKHATADYVMYCDQDDFWNPDKLERSLTEMKTLEKKTGSNKPALVFGDYVPVDNDLKEIPFDPNKNQVAGLHLEFNRLLVQNYVTGCLMMANKPLYEMLGDYDESIEMHDWWAALIASSMGGISHFNAVVMKYRQHGDNVVGVTDVKSMEYRLAKIKDKNTRNKKYSYRDQAVLFKERFYDQLGDTAKKQLDDFIGLYSKKSKLGRMTALIRGNYLKSDLVRQLGQLWYI